MRFQVFLSLWSVTSWLCIDKIRKVAIKIFFIKVKALPRPPKTAHSNTPPHVYVTVWEDLHITAQTYTQWKKAFTFTFMHLADAFIQSDLHCIQVTVFTFYQLLLSLGIEPMILALLAPCSTIWATGKLVTFTEGITFILTVVLLPPRPCHWDAVCFVGKRKYFVWPSKWSTQLEISG